MPVVAVAVAVAVFGLCGDGKRVVMLVNTRNSTVQVTVAGASAASSLRVVDAP